MLAPPPGRARLPAVGRIRLRAPHRRIGKTDPPAGVSQRVMPERIHAAGTASANSEESAGFVLWLRNFPRNPALLTRHCLRDGLLISGLAAVAAPTGWQSYVAHLYSDCIGPERVTFLPCTECSSCGAGWQVRT
jgi:hypothetical protein